MSGNTRSGQHTLLWCTLGAIAGGLGWLQHNPALLFVGSSLLVSGTAFQVGPRLFGKRSNGTLPLAAYVLHAPFLLATWSGWQVRRRRAEDAANEIVPGVWLGRRPTRTEAQQYSTVIDLTAELPGASTRGYHTFPTMDGTAPEVEQVSAFLDVMEVAQRPVLVHCLEGKGRSATMVVAWLVHQGMQPEIALAALQRERPEVDPNRKQRNRLGLVG